MQLKVDSVEKQLKSNKQFLEVKLYFHMFSSLCSECFNVVMVINRLKIHFFKQTNLLFWSSFSVLWQISPPRPLNILLNFIGLSVNTCISVFCVIVIFLTQMLELTLQDIESSWNQVLLNKFSVPKENESKLKKNKGYSQLI